MRHGRMSTDDKECRWRERKRRRKKRGRERECDEKRKVFPRKSRLEKKWLMRPDVRLLLAWIIAFPMTKQKLTPHFPKHRCSRQITSQPVDNRDKSSTSLARAYFSLPGQDSKSTKCFRLLFHADITWFQSIPLWKKKKNKVSQIDTLWRGTTSSECSFAWPS